VQPSQGLRPFFRGARPLAFAHRGGSLLWPENTMAAFRGAVEMGYEYLETDVHASRDGIIVTIHDATLDRTTDGSGSVSDRTLAEIKRCDAGYRFSLDGGSTFPLRGQGLTVPTLAEVAEAFPNVRLNVDIKQKEPPIVDAMVALIDEHSLHDRILVASFQDEVVRAFRERAGGTVATSAAMGEARRFWLASRVGLAGLLATPYDALQVTPRYGRLTIVDGRFVRAAHRRGLDVHVWTVDDAGEMRQMLALGVDGLMSDRPDLLVEVLGRRALGQE
jgi:glycerophosphoryl diester phosphodiesterase